MYQKSIRIYDHEIYFLFDHMKQRLLFIFFILIFSGAGFSQVYVPEPAWYKTYDVKFYFPDLEISDTSTYIKGNTLIKVLIKEQTDTLVFDFNPNIVIDSVLLGQQKVKWNFSAERLIVRSPVRLLQNAVLDVTVYYRGNVNTGSFFSSVSNEYHSYWNIPVTWTLSEPFGAKYWFPNKQQLTDKADSCWIFLTIPKGRKAGSAGVLTDTVNVGNNQVQYQWKTRYPIAYYLISFAVANYKDYSFYVAMGDGNDSLLVKNYIYNRPGYLESTKSEIDRTASFLKLYSKLFGVYPFIKEKYGHCVAPIGGGMEHQTMTTLNNFGYTLVSHELAHQWFGDNTTCATWQDIWVNEGFASYAEYLAYENLNSRVEADAWMNNAQSRALREPEGSVFIPSSEANDEYRIFSTNLSYKKGAVILHILRKQINNDTLFFRSLRSFLAKYWYSTATGEDFKKVVEQETGLNLQKFFDQWYYGKGYPEFDISWKTSTDTLFLNVSQTGKSFFSTPFDVKATGKDFDTTFRLEQNTNPQMFKIKLPGAVTSFEFDPDNWLLKKVQGINQLPEIPSDDNYFEVKPNPFTNELVMTFKNESAEDEKVEIIGLNGRVLSKTIIKRKKETSINTSGIQPGTYLLVVSHGNEKYVRKIFKANVY